MRTHLPCNKGHDHLLKSHSGKTSDWDLKIQAWVSVMQPPGAAGNFMINGKEWKHMAQKFLAQDCSSNLSAPVNVWHCPSCLQSLRDIMLSSSQSAFGWPLSWSCLLWPWLVCCTQVKTVGAFTDSWKIKTSQTEESLWAPCWLQTCA